MREKGLSTNERNREDQVRASDGLYDRKLCGGSGKSGDRDVAVR